MNSFFVITLTDIINIALTIICLIALLVVFIPIWWRNLTCKHEKYYENSACHAICRNCGKDLGSIQTIRDKRKQL